MDRIKQLNEIAQVCLKQRYIESMENINEFYLAHKNEIWSQYEQKLRDGLEECEKQDQKVQYIIISLLDSSLLTKSYEIQITFFDEKTYLEEDPVCRYWCPDFLFKSLDEDMAFFRKKASQKVIRLKEYETDNILKKYILNYYYQAFILIRDMTSEVIERLYLDLGCMSEFIQVLFGRYMDKPLLIYQKGDRKD